MPLDDRQSEAHLGSRSWAVGIPIANRIVSSSPVHSIKGSRHQWSGNSMQHVIRKLYSDGRTSACDCSSGLIRCREPIQSARHRVSTILWKT